MKFQYIIRVNGLVMCSAPTKQRALAKVTQHYHNTAGVTIEVDGILIWGSK